MSALIQSIHRNAIGLGLFAAITAGTIAVTQALTKERIREQEHKAEVSALFEVIPEALRDNDLLNAALSLPSPEELNLDAGTTGWVARLNGNASAILLPVVSHEGYSGEIRLLVGISQRGEITGVRITRHRETPGLGDYIDRTKSDWIERFKGRTLEGTDWAVRKDGGDFDQFTGATVSPRAVVNAVSEALGYFERHRPALLNRPDNGSTGEEAKP